MQLTQFNRDVMKKAVDLLNQTELVKATHGGMDLIEAIMAIIQSILPDRYMFTLQ